MPEPDVRRALVFLRPLCPRCFADLPCPDMLRGVPGAAVTVMCCVCRLDIVARFYDEQRTPHA